MNLVVPIRNLAMLLICDHVEGLAKSHRHAADNTVLASLLSSPLLRPADVADMVALLNLLVPAGGWLDDTWCCEFVLMDRLVDAVAKSNERDQIAGLPECGDLTAADCASKLCSVTHDEGLDKFLFEILLVSNWRVTS